MWVNVRPGIYNLGRPEAEAEVEQQIRELELLEEAAQRQLQEVRLAQEGAFVRKEKADAEFEQWKQSHSQKTEAVVQHRLTEAKRLEESASQRVKNEIVIRCGKMF